MAGPITEEKLDQLKITFLDPFHFKQLYKNMFNWLEDEQYIGPEGIVKEDLEILYSEQDRGGFREFHIWWRPVRTAKNKYFKYHLNIDFFGLGITNKEIVKNDQKIKLQVGEINILINPVLKYEQNGDWSKWENNILAKYLRKKFKEKWYKKIINENKEELRGHAYVFQQKIKEFLEVHQYTRHEHMFYPKH